MARRKCYFCEERFDEDDTTLASFRVGGNYRTPQRHRDVRACYRCVAAKRYKTTFHNCTDRDKVEGMAKRGWTIPSDYNDHGWGWGVFDLLWPEGGLAPLDPTTLPKHLCPPPRWVWPLKGADPVLPDPICNFGAVRRFDVHAGVDLFCELGTEVVAVEDGEVYYIEIFTGLNAESRPSPWWNETFSIKVRGATGVVHYGECTPTVKMGDKVKAGQVIAVVDTPVLKAFRGRPMVMLHLELWARETVGTTRWGSDPTPPAERVQPPNLLNPISHLMNAARDTVWFDIKDYDGERFRDPSAEVKASRWWAMWGGESPPKES